MQALSVRRPYADLLVHGLKPVEYRRWFQRGRTGPTLIHAARSTAWRHQFAWYKLRDPGSEDCGWGALLGLVTIVVVFHVRHLDYVLARRPELNYLLRVDLEGPYCYVVQAPWRFCRPVRWTGAQRFFDVPEDVFADELCQDADGRVHRASQYAELAGVGV